MERFINKIDGSESKLDLSTFLKIRKISVSRYLSDNEINSSESLEMFLTRLETSSHFDVSDVFKNEARQLFIVTASQQEQKNEATEEVIIVTNQEQTETVADPNNKLKKKKPAIS